MFKRPAQPKTPAILQEGWPDNVRTDDVAFEEWQQDLEDQRELYAQNPTLVANRTLGIQLQIQPIPVHDDAQSRRKVPICAQKETEIQITLVRPLRELHPEDNAPARIWLAKTLTDETVVAKFFCASFHVPTQRYEDFFGEYRLPHQCARIEQMAYEALQSAQGRWLPYFMGRHQVQFDHGEWADLILLEYIPGKTLYAYRSEHHLKEIDGEVVEHQPDDPVHAAISKWHSDWFSRIRDIVQEMHRAGITHGDLNTQNIILHRNDSGQDSSGENGVESGGDYHFVVIDFEQARDDYVHGCELRVAAQGLLCCDSHALTLAEWCISQEIPIAGWYADWPGIYY